MKFAPTLAAVGAVSPEGEVLRRDSKGVGFLVVQFFSSGLFHT